MLILSPGAQGLFCSLHCLILPTRGWTSPHAQEERPSCWPEGSVMPTSLCERDWSPSFCSRRRSPARLGVTHRPSSLYEATSHWSVSGCSLADGQTPRSQAPSQRSGFSEIAGSRESEASPGAYLAGSMVLAVTEAGACSAVSVTDAYCNTFRNQLTPLSQSTQQLPQPAPRSGAGSGGDGLAASGQGQAEVRRHQSPTPRSTRHDGLFHCGPTPAAGPQKLEGVRKISRSLPCPPPGLTPSMPPRSARLVELGCAYRR